MDKTNTMPPVSNTLYRESNRAMPRMHTSKEKKTSEPHKRFQQHNRRLTNCQNRFRFGSHRDSASSRSELGVSRPDLSPSPPLAPARYCTRPSTLGEEPSASEVLFSPS